MAANLMGMFEQMNRAILRNPLGNESGAGQQMLDMASQGVGQMGGALSSKIDPYSMMTPAAQLMQSKQDLASLDLSKVSDMKVAAGIYNKTGQQEKALALQTRASEQEEKDAQNLMNNKMMAALVDRVHKDSELDPAKKQRYYAAIHAGFITNDKDYDDYKNHAVLNAAKGAYTEEVVIGGKAVKVRYNSANIPVAVLGDGQKKYDMVKLFNPATNTEQQALVNLLDPTETKFLGGNPGAEATYRTVYNSDSEQYDILKTPAGGGPEKIIGHEQSENEALNRVKKEEALFKSINMVAALDEALALVESEDSFVGGWAGLLKYLPKTEARKLEALVLGIKANVGFDALRKLKESGGTLGQISNIENMLLQSTVRTLDTLTDKKDIKEALETIRGVTRRTTMLMNASPEELERVYRPLKDNSGVPTGQHAYQVNSNTWVVVDKYGSMETIKGEVE